MRFLLILLVSAFSINSFAANTFMMAGGQYSMADFESPRSGSTDGAFGAQLGIRSKIPATELLYFIAGLDLAYKATKLTATNVNQNLSFLSFELPIFVGFNVMKDLGLYVGPKISVLMNTFCTGPINCITINEYTKEITYPVQAGAQYQLTEKLGVEVYYERGIIPVYKNSMTAEDLTMHLVGANLTYFF